MSGYGQQASLPQRIAEQEQVDKANEQAAHLREMHRLFQEIKEALDYADPMPQFEPNVLDPSTEILVRYEQGRSRYAICTTDSAGTKVNATYAGQTWMYTTTQPGWLPLDLPSGTRLTSGDANRHFIIIRRSNLKA